MYINPYHFFSVGSNDIAHSCTIEGIVSDLEHLRNHAQETGAYCLIGEIPCRSNPRGMPLEQYRQCRNSINRRLKSRFGNITYEHLEDGVHLDSLTSNYYINNIKKAIKELL